MKIKKSNILLNNFKKNNVFEMIVGPNEKEENERVLNKKCSFIEYDYNGKYKYSCNNNWKLYKCKFGVNKINIRTNGMLCEKCIKKLSEKYNIDFKNELVFFYILKKLINSSPKFFNGNVYTQDELNKFELIISNREDPTQFKLINSIMEYLKEDCYLTSFEDIKNNDELNWILNVSYLSGLPNYWLNNYKIKQYNGKNTSNQGKINGPDFIFLNENNEDIGFELVTYQKLIYSSFNEQKEFEKKMQQDVIHSLNLDDHYKELKNIILSKNQKQYFPCKEYFLGIVVSRTISEYEYWVLEILLNKFNYDQKTKFFWVFIL